MRTISCRHLIGAAAGAHEITLAGGHITAVTAAAGATDALLVMPALVNAHDHGRAIRSSAVGGGGKPLETWINYLALLPSVDPYLGAVVALGQSALGGSGSVMVHYTRVQGFTDLPTEAAAVARAANDLGVRTGLAVSMRDRNPLVYGPSEPILAALPADARNEVERRFLRAPLPVAEQLALVDAVAAAAAGPLVDVQYGPNGVQWCSDALLAAIAEASARTGRRVHMHMLETRYQRDWMDATYPGGVLRHLDAIGMLSPRLTLAHCVWARPDELALLAERGVTISVNNSSNLHLRSGLAPLAAMRAAGCRVAFGIDAKALDEDDDALRELRLAQLLHAGTGFAPVPLEPLLREAVAHGRQSVSGLASRGTVEVGEPADLLLLDWAMLEDDNLREDLDPVPIVLSRATARHVRELIVAGRTVVKDGRVLGVDVPAARDEVRAAMRAGMTAQAGLSAALEALDRAIAGHYQPDAPCC